MAELPKSNSGNSIPRRKFIKLASLVGVGIAAGSLLDGLAPPAQRLTQTNILKLTAQTPLEESGLLGPMRIVESSASPNHSR